MKSAGLLALAVFGSVAAATPIDSLDSYRHPESILVRENIKTGKSEVLNSDAQVEKAFWDGEGQYPQQGGGGYPGGGYPGGPDDEFAGGPGGPGGPDGQMMGGPMGGPNGPGAGPNGPYGPMGPGAGGPGGMRNGPPMGGPGPGNYGYNNYGPGGGYPPGAGEVYYNNSPYCGGPAVEESGGEEYRVRRYYRRYN